MAKTFTYTDVLGVVGKSMPKAIEDQFSSLASNLATNLIWYGYDWRESLKILPPFYLTANEQDHTLPPAIIPSDFHGLRKCQLCQFYSGSAPHKRDLFVTKDLLLTAVETLPTAIAYEPSVSGFRVFPRVPSNIGAPIWFIEGTYKCRPVKITNAILNTVLPFDDMYLSTMIESVRWALLVLSGSPNAGTVTIQGGQTVYTGQLALALAAIEQMATQEGVNDGDIHIAPESALVPLSSGW